MCTLLPLPEAALECLASCDPEGLRVGQEEEKTPVHNRGLRSIFLQPESSRPTDESKAAAPRADLMSEDSAARDEPADLSDPLPKSLPAEAEGGLCLFEFPAPVEDIAVCLGGTGLSGKSLRPHQRRAVLHWACGWCP